MAASYSQTPEERRKNLEIGNEIRLKRAQLKKDLKAGRVKIHDLLLDPPDYIETMQISNLLLAVPMVGQDRVNRTLKATHISASRQIGMMNERQRGEILHALKKSSGRIRAEADQ